MDTLCVIYTHSNIFLINFQIKRNKIVVTVFLLITNQTEFNHIPLNLNVVSYIFICAYLCTGHFKPRSITPSCSFTELTLTTPISVRD